MISTFKHTHLFNSTSEMRALLKQFIPRLYCIEGLRKITGVEDLIYQTEPMTLDWSVCGERADCHVVSKDKTKRGMITIVEGSTTIFVDFHNISGFEPVFRNTTHILRAIRPSEKIHKSTERDIKSSDVIEYYCAENVTLKGKLSDLVLELGADWGGDALDFYRRDFPSVSL